MKSILSVLKKSSLFLGKTEAEIEDIISKADYKIMNYKKNEIIFYTFSKSSFVGIVLEGSVIIQKNLPTGKIVNNTLKKAGESFGGITIFSDISTYPCDITAKENCSILFIPKSYMKNLILSDSLINFNVLSTMSANMLMFDKQTELLAYSSIQEKIAFFLISNSRTQNNCSIVNLPYSKKMWAEFLNVSRPSLYRELKKLCNDKIIEIDENCIKILNLEKLELLL